MAGIKWETKIIQRVTLEIQIKANTLKAKRLHSKCSGCEFKSHLAYYMGRCDKRRSQGAVNPSRKKHRWFESIPAHQ